jgi:hypothetical protein
MKIGGTTSPYANYPSVKPLRDKRSDGTKEEATDSLFAKYLNAKPAENFTSHVKVGYEHGSPFCQLLDDYRAWKQDQQDAALPSVDSSEAEKVSYLREHYSDASDGMKLFDALTAMKDMGMISQVEYSYATGGPLIRVSKEEMESGSFSTSTGERDERTYWGGAFMKSPLVSFHGLDDIFNWLEEFRKEDHPFSISQAEAKLLGII